jgi:hypothetical protein
MEGKERPHTDKYKENTNDWNYDASCTLTSLLVGDLECFKCLISVAQCVQRKCTNLYHHWFFSVLYCM